MQKSPSWEARRFSGSQELRRILCNPKDHYRIHNSPQTLSILSQTNLVLTLPPPSHFLKFNFNTI